MVKLLFAILFFISNILLAQDCTKSSGSFIPITDLAGQSFNGYAGGKYPEGKNEIPKQHFKTGLEKSVKIIPIGTNGNSDISQGKIGFLILGFSTAAMTGNYFKWLCNQKGINKKIQITIGAQGGMDINTMIGNDATYWSQVTNKLKEEALTKNQVQMIWLTTGDLQSAKLPFPAQSIVQVDKYKLLLRKIKFEFPNCQIVFISDRTYAGYIDAKGPEALAEPTAYYNSWAVKFLIEKQIESDPEFNYADIPFVDWGPMLWTNGVKGNNNGYTWDCADAGKGGIHPTARGRAKEATLLYLFFTNHPYTKNLFTSE